MTTEREQTMRSASAIGLLAAGSALIGFIVQLLVAYYFGASSQTDAYFMAQSTSELLSKLLLGGSITAVFLPLFVERLQSGKPGRAWELALNLLHVTCVVLLIIGGLLVWLAEPFVSFIAPGFDAPTSQLTVTLLRLLLPSFIILFLVDIAVAMLHALQAFTIPALLRLITSVATSVALLIGARHIGIYALAWGAVIGSILQLILTQITLGRHGFRYQFIFKLRDPGLQRLFQLVFPFVFSALVTQVAGIVYRILASNLAAGSLSALKYAEKITQLVTIIFLHSITVVIYPVLSKKASQGDRAGMRDTIAAAIRLTTCMCVPLMIGIAILRYPLITLLFQRGSFTQEDVALTSVALLFLIIGLATNAISSIFGHAVLALQRTKVAVVVSIASQVVAISLFWWLVPQLQHAGLALASAMVPIATAILYYAYLSRLIPHLHTIFQHTFFVKVGVLGSLLAGILLIVQSMLNPLLLHPFWQLIIPTIIGSAVFFGGAYLWHVEEIHDLTRLFTKKVRRLLPTEEMAI